MTDPQMQNSTRSTINFFYSAHSAFAYLGYQKLYDIAQAHDVVVSHKPIDLDVVVKAAGSQLYPTRGKDEKFYYFGREVERWSQFRGVEMLHRTPTYHYNPLDLASGVLIAGALSGVDMQVLGFAVLESHWRYDADLANADELAGYVAKAGIDPASLIEAAARPDVRAIYEANTQAAIDLRLFGSPSFILDGDMYLGQDRLELIEYALTEPFCAHKYR